MVESHRDMAIGALDVGVLGEIAREARGAAVGLEVEGRRLALLADKGEVRLRGSVTDRAPDERQRQNVSLQCEVLTVQFDANVIACGHRQPFQ